MARENIFREKTGKAQVSQRAVKRRHARLIAVRRIRIEHTRFQRLRCSRAEPTRVAFEH